MMEKRYNGWSYDEEEVRTITQQITESYESGMIDDDDASYYDPRREVGE
ncbi:hypothetical protein AB4J90_15130 [Geobacillus thermodenitrificans]|jgi:hypothetical protein|nr:MULTISPECIES: hypothetical protein [Geobacillus]QNU33132.1 hypothetical protein IC804_05635 [Geobacillus sp. 47C-IIb]